MKLNMDSEPINQLRRLIVSNSNSDRDLTKLLVEVMCKASVDQFNGEDCSEYFQGKLFRLDCKELGVDPDWAISVIKHLTDPEKVVNYYKSIRRYSNG